MKTIRLIQLLLIFSCVIMQNACAFNKKVNGNEKIITKNFSISDYDKIEIEGGMEFDYTQSNAAPKLEITLDENLFDYLDIYAKNNTLVIKKKKNYDEINIKPTVYQIKSNSSALSKLRKAGSCNFNILNQLNTNNLVINSAGSGNIICKNNVNVSDLNVDITGSGSIVLKGELNQAKINLSGSGDIGTYECCINSLDCSIAGSGNIKLWITNHLSYSIAGSGNLKYKGNPQLGEHNIADSGKVIKE